jgi:hypothetical protein
MIVDELIAILGFDLRGEGDLRKFEQGMKGAERGAKGFASSLTKLAGVAAAAFGGLQLGRMAGNFVASIATVNAQFETYEATLKTITGSAEEARRSMEWITEFGRTTPYEAGQVTEAFVRLKSYGIDPMDGSLRTVGDAASAMGKSLMQGVEAIADAVTGENERLKEFGIRAAAEGDNITYSWTENGKALTRTVKKDAVEIQSALMDIFGRFSGAMDEQSKTWVGMTSNLSDSWTEFLREIGDAGYYDDIKRRMQGVLDFTNQAFESGLVANVAKGISDGLIGSINTVSHLATQAYRIGRGFYYAADGVVSLIARVNGLGKATTAIGLGAGLLATSAFGRRAMMAVARRVPMIAGLLVIDDLLSALNGDDSIIGTLEGGQEAIDRINASFKEMVDGANGVADAINGILGISQLAGENPLDAFTRSAKGFASTEIVRFLNEMADTIQQITTALNAIGEVLNNPEAAWERFVSAAIAQIDRLVAAIDQKLGGALTRFGFIGPEQVAEPIPEGSLGSTGVATRTPETPRAYTDDALDAKFRAQNAEGRRVAPATGDPIVVEVNEAQLREAAAKTSAAADWLAGKLGMATDVITGSRSTAPATGPVDPRPPAPVVNAAPTPPSAGLAGTVTEVVGPIVAKLDQVRAAVMETASREPLSYTPEAQLVRDGRQNAEGLRVEYGVSEEDSVAAATRIGEIIASISNMTATAKALLDITGFMAPANQALAIQADLSRGINATATLDVSQWMAAADRAEARLRSLQTLAGARAAGPVQSRPQVVQPAAAP